MLRQAACSRQTVAPEEIVATRPGLGLLISLVILAGCSSAATPARDSAAGSSLSPASPKRLVAAISGEPKILTNKISSASAGGVPGLEAVEEFIHAGLTNVSDRGVL